MALCPISNSMKEGKCRAICRIGHKEMKKWRSYWMTTNLFIAALRVVIAPRWNSTFIFSKRRQKEEYRGSAPYCLRAYVKIWIHFYECILLRRDPRGANWLKQKVAVTRRRPLGIDYQGDAIRGKWHMMSSELWVWKPQILKTTFFIEIICTEFLPVYCHLGCDHSRLSWPALDLPFWRLPLSRWAETGILYSNYY